MNMAEGGFFARLFGLEDTNSETENRIEDTVETNTIEFAGTTLQDAVNFVAELQSYYYNDICKMQSDLVVQTFNVNEEKLINKKIKQDKTALSQIDQVLNEVKENEKEYQTVWKKSVYSFYDEIEKVKLASVQAKVFAILIQLYAINTKQELDTIILNRIEKYKEAWNISEEIQIPKNFNAILIDGSDGIEKYRFGEFYKSIHANDTDIVLDAKQLNQIRALEFEFTDDIPTDEVWVYVSNVTRLQLNFMRRNCMIGNTWEQLPKNKLILDVVKTKNLKQYLKGVLQIVFTKNAHAVISIVVPTREMLSVIGPIKKDGKKVEIVKRYRFYLKERSGLYKNNLITTRISRRRIPEKVQFISYLEFKKMYF